MSRRACLTGRGRVHVLQVLCGVRVRHCAGSSHSHPLHQRHALPQSRQLQFQVAALKHWHSVGHQLGIAAHVGVRGPCLLRSAFVLAFLCTRSGGLICGAACERVLFQGRFWWHMPEVNVCVCLCADAGARGGGPRGAANF